MTILQPSRIHSCLCPAALLGFLCQGLWGGIRVILTQMPRTEAAAAPKSPCSFVQCWLRVTGHIRETLALTGGHHLTQPCLAQSTHRPFFRTIAEMLSAGMKGQGCPGSTAREEGGRPDNSSRQTPRRLSPLVPLDFSFPLLGLAWYCMALSKLFFCVFVLSHLILLTARGAELTVHQ